MNDRTRRWLIRGGLAVVLLVALGYAAIFIYANVINDSPDEFDDDDLAAALEDTIPADGGTTPSSTAGSTTSGSTTPGSTAGTPAATEAAAVPTTAAAAGFDGTWQVTTASEFGYRIEEVLAGVNTTAVGRGSQIEGSLTIDGTAATAGEFTVDVASITSDESRRDGQFRGRVMNVDQFPTANFAITAPIEFGAAPAPGERVTASASGDLTLHGVTRPVTFEVTAQANADRIGVRGQIPVLFSDYEIDNPSFGTVKTEDNGLLEFILVFERAP